LKRKELKTDTQVWRKGMPEWKSLRESDLAEFVAAEPPAISAQHIGSGYVWTLALLPLVVGLIEAAVSASNQEAAACRSRYPFSSMPCSVGSMIEN
jgi:hypothetical protein